MRRTIPAKRPIRDNLLRQLTLAQEHLKSLYELETEGCSLKYQIANAEREVEKLTRLTR